MNDCPHALPDNVIGNYGLIGKVVTCRNCEALLRVEYDESYDESSVDGEEFQEWFFSVVSTP